MIKYENLLNTMLGRFPKVKGKYEKGIETGLIFEDSGMHIVFSYAFVPVLSEALMNDAKLATEMFAMLEEMELSDSDVAEICEFTVLEELCDNYSDQVILQYADREITDAIKCIRMYIPQSV